MYAILIVIHIIVSIVLIAVILLQAGKGGGLSETFGGGTTRTLFGTKADTFLTRATSVCAVVFLLTCLLLAIMSIHRGRSLMERQGSRIQRNIPKTQTTPAVPQKVAGTPMPEAEQGKAHPQQEPQSPPSAKPPEQAATDTAK